MANESSSIASMLQQLATEATEEKRDVSADNNTTGTRKVNAAAEAFLREFEEKKDPTFSNSMDADDGGLL